MIAISTKKLAFGAMGCLLLAACGSGKSTTAASAGPPATGTASAPVTASAAARGGGGGLTACGLLTENEASKALGTAAGKGSGGGGAALSECIYGDGALIVSMKTDSKALYTKQHADATAKGATDVPGVGDSAFDAGTAQNCTLAFLKGTALVSVLYGGTDAMTVCVAVAKIASSKL